MKDLTTYINENFKISKTTSVFDGKFIYKPTTYGAIKIFDSDWSQYNDFKDNVYIQGEHVELDAGWTTENYDAGEYEFEIKYIYKVTDCQGMFWDCYELATVPLFVFVTNKEINMSNMFYGCTLLDKETHRLWSKIYDFEKQTGK